MAAVIPSTEPISAVSGDTWLWTRSLTDYKASDGWILSYAFRMQNGAGMVNATATTTNITDFSLTIQATTTATMVPGIWTWAAYVTLSGERHQVDAGTLTVTPNLATIDSSYDFRSPARLAFDNAMKAWQAVSLGQTVMLKGRTYTQQTMPDLILYMNRCKADYAAELQAEQLASTGINPRKIGVRLSRDGQRTTGPWCRNV